MPKVLSVLFARRALPIAASSFLARLPKGITPLAIAVLMLDATGSAARAGAVVAALALGDAFATPLQGRLIDRFGRAFTLVPSALLYSCSLAALVTFDEGLAASLGCAFVAGCGFPPISGSIKALWPRLVDRPELVREGFAAESLLQQVLLLVAPLLAMGVIAWMSPGAALLIAAAAAFSGTVCFVILGARIDTTPAPGRRLPGGVLRIRALRVIVASTAVQGMVFGALPVIAPALARPSPSVGGLLLAIWICGGISGSFLKTYGRYSGLLARFAAALTMVALTAIGTSGWLPAIGIMLALAGLLLTPIAAASYLLVEACTPDAARTEAFAWLSTALAIGGAAGSALAGTIIEATNASIALLLPAVSAAIATVIAVRLDHGYELGRAAGHR